MFAVLTLPAYFPRHQWRNRSGFSCLFCTFIFRPLSPIRHSGAEYSNAVWTVAVANHQQTIRDRETDCHKSTLVFRMLRIVQIDRRLVVEDGGSLLKKDTVFEDVALGFCLIPLKSRQQIQRRSGINPKCEWNSLEDSGITGVSTSERCEQLSHCADDEGHRA
jgi:hypothetical protein